MINEERLDLLLNFSKFDIKGDKEEFLDKLNKVLKSLEPINELDLDNLDPIYGPFEKEASFREDKAQEGLTRDEALANTRESQYGYFKLMNIMEQED